MRSRSKNAKSSELDGIAQKGTHPAQQQSRRSHRKTREKTIKMRNIPAPDNAPHTAPTTARTKSNDLFCTESAKQYEMHLSSVRKHKNCSTRQKCLQMETRQLSKNSSQRIMPAHQKFKPINQNTKLTSLSPPSMRAYKCQSQNGFLNNTYGYIIITELQDFF